MVADFIGKMNLFPGRLVDGGNGVLRVESEIGLLRFDRAGLAAPRAGDIGVAVRPEKIALSSEPPGDGMIAVRGTVAQVAYLGDASLVYVETAAGQRITCSRPTQRRNLDAPIAVGAACWLAWQPADCLLLTD
jgi:putrescine transport system ATP-binding protein